MGYAGKWSCRLLLTAVVSTLAVGVLPGSAAAAEGAPAVPADQSAQPVMEPAPAVAEATAPVAEASAPVAEPSPPPAQPSTPTAASGEPAAARTAPQLSAQAGRAAPVARSGRVQAARHGARGESAQGTASEPGGTHHAPVCTMSGTDGDDTLQGTPGDDVICGGGGDDTIDGGGGDDTIDGGEGSDSVDGQEGDDVLEGGAGNDVVVGDEPAGNSGQDRISCGDGRDGYTSSEGDEVAGDCETRLIVDNGGDSLLETGSDVGADAPARVGSALIAVGPTLAEARRHPVAVTERNLVVQSQSQSPSQKRTIELVLMCRAGTEGKSAHLTLTTAGRERTKLATASFRCEQIGSMVVTLRPTRALERLLQDHGAVRARLSIRIRHRTVRTGVTITQG
jgi:hypothetical protein